MGWLRYLEGEIQQEYCMNQGSVRDQAYECGSCLRAGVELDVVGTSSYAGRSASG